MLNHDGRYVGYYCNGTAGDYIGYMESSSKNGPYRVRPEFFFPNRAQGQLHLPISWTTFDGAHVCDPSVIQVNGVYYLYYGANGDISGPVPGVLEREVFPAQFQQQRVLEYSSYPRPMSATTTFIGVATSIDGKSWTRRDLPIIAPFGDPSHAHNFLNAYHYYHPWAKTTINGRTEPLLVNRMYGAGQPSVVQVKGWFYLAYHDSTGVASNSVNGGGIYVLRSRNPLFPMSETQELRCPSTDVTPAYTSGGCANPYWGQVQGRPTTRYSILDAIGISLSYNPVTQQFVILQKGGGSHVLYLMNELFRIQSRVDAQNNPQGPEQFYLTEGPALLSRGNGQLLPPFDSNACDLADVSFMSAIGNPHDVHFWDLAITNRSLKLAVSSCNTLNAAEVYDQFLVVHPGLPLAYVADGKRVQFASGATALSFSQNLATLSSPLFHQLPYGGSLHLRQQVIGATGRPAAFNLDAGRWNVGCIEAILTNQSFIQMVSQPAFDATRFMGSLHCQGLRR